MASLPWEASFVYHYFRIWRIDSTWKRLNAALRERLRIRLGRNLQPSAGMADSRSAETTGVGGEARATMAGRRFVVGRVICWWIRKGWCSKPRCPAQISDQDGIKLVLEGACDHPPRLSRLWVAQLPR